MACRCTDGTIEFRCIECTEKICRDCILLAFARSLNFPAISSTSKFDVALEFEFGGCHLEISVYAVAINSLRNLTVYIAGVL